MLTGVNVPKKIILDADETLWREVLKFKIDRGLKKNNDAVIELIRRGLKNKKKPM